MKGFQMQLGKKKRVSHIHDLLLRGYFHRILGLVGPKEIMCSLAIFGIYLHTKNYCKKYLLLICSSKIHM